MNINELTDGLIYKISGLYPTIDIEGLRKKVSEMQIVETDIGEQSPIRFEQDVNILRLNSDELASGKYDLEYYMTTFLLLMTKNYDVSLQGLRVGYFSGIASNLVGNFASETEIEVEPGIDLFEPLRVGIADLNDRLGHDIACELCEANSLSEFIEFANKVGLENPEQFLAPYNYLAINYANLSESQVSGLAKDIVKNNDRLNLGQNAKQFN